MIKTLIVDDEPHARGSLRLLLEAHFPNLELVGEATNVAEGLSAIREHSPQLVFLDIEMPDGTGFDLLEQVETVDFEVIFATAYDSFAIRAFQCSAYAYLLKPVGLDDLEKALSRLEKHLSLIPPSGDNRIKVLVDFFEKENQIIKKIILEGMDGFEVVKLQELVYLEGDGNCTHFFLTNGKKRTVSKTLKEYEKLLESHGFFRVHKSYMINLSHVRSVQRGSSGVVHLVGEMEVPVSRRRKQALVEKFT